MNFFLIGLKTSSYKAIKPLYLAVYGAIFYGALKAGLNLFFKKKKGWMIK